MTTRTDSFNRANETPLASPWAACTRGGAALINNVVTASQSNQDQTSYYNDTWGNDQESMATVGNLAANTNFAMLLVRADGNGNAFLFSTDGQSGLGHTEFARYSSGSYTALGGIATAFANGDKARLTVSGTSPNITLTAYKDSGSGWVQVGQLTGVTGPDSGAPGVGAYNTATIDDWTGTDGATLTQAAFRFFNDDGSESASTPMAAQDANTNVAANTNFRIRFGIQATGDPSAIQFQLEYDEASGSNWKVVN